MTSSVLLNTPVPSMSWKEYVNAGGGSLALKRLSGLASAAETSLGATPAVSCTRRIDSSVFFGSPGLKTGSW